MTFLRLDRRFFPWLMLLFLCSVVLAGGYRAAEHSPFQDPGVGVTAEPEEPAGRQGFLVTLNLQGGQVRLIGAAEIDNFTQSKHLVAGDDWFLILYGENGERIGSSRISNPNRFSPRLFDEQELPFMARFPRMAGLSAAAICDQYMEERLRIPIDGSFRIAAAASRQAFLRHESENRRLLNEAARRGQGRAAAGAVRERTPFRLDDAPEDLRRQITGEISAEMEQLEEFGPEVMRLKNIIPAEPAAIKQMLERERIASLPVAAAPGFYAAAAYTLSGKVRDQETAAPLAGVSLSFYQYDASGKYVGFIASRTTDAAGSYSIGVDAGSVTIVPSYPTVSGKRYAPMTQTADIQGDTTRDIAAVPGALLSGSVTNSQNQAVIGVSLRAQVNSLSYTFSASTSAKGDYSMVVPVNRAMNLTIVPPSPYVRPPAENGIVLTADTVRNYKVETGWLVTGIISGEGSVPINRASVLLRQLAATTTGAPNWVANTDAQGKFSFAVPKNLDPNDFILAAYAQNYVLQALSLQVDRDLNRNLQLEKGITLSGTIRDSSEKTLSGARVRAFNNGGFVNSGLTNSTGAYSLDLPAGAYEIEVLPPAGSQLSPSLSKGVVMSEPRTLDVVLTSSADVLTVRLYFPSEAIYSRFSNKSLVRFELYQQGLTVYAGGGSGSGGYDSARSKFYRSYTLYSGSGKFALIAFVAGCQPISVAGVEVSGQASVSIDVPEPFLWTGILRGADGKPLAGMTVQSYTDLARENELTVTSASGQFSILLTPNGFAKFFADPASSNILHTERFGNVNGGRNADIVLEAFPPFSDSGSPLTQIYGVPDQNSRWNIVMIGDGYTAITETFTDANNNGQWDGVLYYDLNKNGVWDTGEPSQRYGNAAAPVNGVDPTLTNEPFVDLNGDGVPNLRDMELFDQNTLDTARSLFGQDQWRLHRDAFNIFRIRLVSNQAGHKVMDKDGKAVIDRDTALGTYLNTPERSYLFNANYSLISQYINQYVPACDTRIVMVNQPVRMGRVNSYMFQYGGNISSLGNDYVVAHEMGHNVGLLADEYTEYQETYRGSESASRNITSLADPAKIPWKYLIPPGKEIPSVPGSSGIGLYEGAGYYTGGRYRPTEYCMMVSGNRYCPVCAAEIEGRLRDIMGAIPEAKPKAPTATVSSLYPEFRWDPLTGVSHYILEVEKADGSQVVASYDVYDAAFNLPFALTAGVDYRWRIRPASAGRLGSWTSWVGFTPAAPTSLFTSIFAHIAAGGSYQTTIWGINASDANAEVSVALVKSDGTPFESPAGAPSPQTHFAILPMGTARLELALSGSTTGGFARFSSSSPLDGLALFRTLKGDLVLSEAGVGLAKTAKQFVVYVDNTNNANSGYAIVNSGTAPAQLTLTLRDKGGVARDQAGVSLPPGRHIAEFASQRFKSAAPSGFEGSIQVSSDQDVAAVALRYDNTDLDGDSQAFSTIPVLANDETKTLYFPQVADGSGYRTNFVLVNPSETATTVKLEFFDDSGSPLSLPIDGAMRTSFDLPLSSRGVARMVTEGTSSGISAGWVRVSSPVAIGGSSIFQTRQGNRILSEAGVGASPSTQHFTTFVESLGWTESGIAICNPGAAPAILTMKLRRSTGEVAATASLDLPAGGHVAKFFTQWFPRGFASFEGTLEVSSTAPVNAVALRYDNAQLNVFATLPVIMMP